jgi:hypothetical protein
VRQVGKQLIVVTELNALRGTARAQGSYSGSVKLCNPSCAGGGAGNTSPPKM